MLIDKDLIVKAKQTLGEEATNIIKNDLDLQNWDEKNLKSLCPFHEEQTGSFIWNHKDNAFKCFGCGRHYNIIDHYMQFNHFTFISAIQKLFEQTEIKYSFGEKGVRTQKDYRYPYREYNENRDSVEKYLNTRCISKETLDWTDTQQDRDNNIVFHYYDTNDVLSLVKYRPARKVDKKENKNWCQKDADTAPLLFNMNQIDFTNGPLLIAEGEVDALSAIEAGYKNTVSVPLGANNYGWIEHNWDWLELFDKIIVWSDNDEAGLKMRKEVCSRLGVWRTLYVEAPETATNKDGKEIKIKDINETLYFYGKQKVLDLINEAKELPIEGIEDLSSVEPFDIELAPGLYSGLEPIDKTIYKFLFGSVIVVTGLRGAGKSTLLNQCFVCEPLEQGYDTFIFSGELSSPVLQSWVELSMAGPEQVKMKTEHVHVINVDAIKQMKEWYKGRTWIYNQTDNKLESILDKAVSVTRKYGVKVWLLDNLSTIDIGANDNNVLEKQKNVIVELIKHAKTYNVLIILVIHPRKLQAGTVDIVSDDVGGNGALTNLAQYVISVKRFSQKDKAGERDGKGNWKKGKEPILEDVEVNVLKNRYTGKIEAHKLFFNYKSYRFFSNARELFKRYGWDKNRSRPIPALESEDPRFSSPDFMKD
jgi:twinkle protein